MFHPAAALYTPAMLATLRADFARLPDCWRSPRRATGAGARVEPEPVSPSPSSCSCTTSSWACSKPETWAIVGGRSRVAGAPLNTPLVPASNFVLGTERLYSRSEGTETWDAFEAVIGGLEGGRAVAFFVRDGGVRRGAAAASDRRAPRHPR